jgi:CelD/BcsL family acetyltransferase involved in cellulose biosynthesis
MAALGSISTDFALPTAPRRVTICIYESLDALQALRPSWDQLLSRYPLATTFCTWEWLSCWWDCFGQNHKLFTVALFDSESLLGLAPFSISQEHVGWLCLRVLRLMGDGSGDSDNLDLPVQPGYEEVFAEEILGILSERKKTWDICLLDTLPRESPVVNCLCKSLRSRSWTFFDYSSPRSTIDLPDNWELYARMLSSEDRKNLVRYTRRLQNRQSLRIYRCSREEEIARCLEALFRLHQERWQNAGEPGAFTCDKRRKFYEQLSRCLLARGWLQFWILELDGEIAAAQFAFRYGDNVFQLQEGYDHRRTSDRTGYVLRGAVLERLIQENVQTYDFLGGEDAYKCKWGARKSSYRQLHFAPAFSFGAVWLECVDKASRSKKWIRNTLPPPLWNLLRKAKALLAANS